MSRTYGDAYKMNVVEDFTVRGLKAKKGSQITIRNYRWTNYWYLGDGNHEVEISSEFVRKKLLGRQSDQHPMLIKAVNQEDAKDFIDELNFHKFYLRPNQDLNKVFTRWMNKEEYEKYFLDKKAQAPDLNFRNIPIIEQPMWISWPVSKYNNPEWGSELGAFRDVHGVILSKEIVEKTNMLGGMTYYLEVLEDEEGYKFFLKYNEILGSRWLFKNYKGESWSQ